MAGIAAAVGNINLGVIGAAYNAQVLSSRIFQSNVATSDANIASAVYYAAGRDENGIGSFASVDVMNCSWGGGGYSDAITGAFTYATTSGRGGLGTVVAVASGNGYTSSLLYPAVLSQTNPGMIAVGASTNYDTHASYSQYGPGLDLVAPSCDLGGSYLWIDTTDLTGSAGYTNGDYTGITSSGGFSGTSAAAPLVAGVSELVLSQAAVKVVTLTAAQVRSLLMNGTDLIGGATYDVSSGNSSLFGQGRIDAYTSVDGIGKPGLSVLSSTATVTSGSTMDFGNAFIDGSTTLTYRIRNTGTSELDLSNLAITGPFTIDSLGSTSLGLGQSTTLTVHFAPTAMGAASGTLSFATNDADQPTFTLNLTGTGAANISGRAFEDWNGNGTLDANDPALAGRTVFLDTNGNGILDRASYTASPNAAIPDGNANGLASTISVSGVSVPVDDLTVTVNITHPYDSDIALILTSPAGTTTLLASGVGGTGQNFTGTVFDDAATLPIQNGTAPFTGSFQPEEGSLGQMDGQSADGTWTLTAIDMAGGGLAGTLVNWSLGIDAEPTAVTDSQGDYAFGNLANGTYSVRAATPTGWAATSGSSGYTATVTGPDSSVSNLNFGSSKDNRAYFTVFNDQNADGVFEDGEPGVGGRTVYLDSNDNGSLDTGEASSVTASNGNAYLDLPPGSNAVRLAPQAGWRLTNPASGELTLTAAGAPLYANTFGVAITPTVLPLIVNDGSIQRSMVQSVSVPFSEHVQFSGPVANAFSVTGPTGNAPTVLGPVASVPFTASVDDSGSATKVTLTFAGYSIPDGIYSVAVNASLVTDADLNPLAPAAPQSFFRLFGDADGSGTVDSGDNNAFALSFGITSPGFGFNAAFDFDHSGTVDSGDLNAFSQRFGITLV